MTLVGGYIYALLGQIVALIAVMVGAHFLKKGWRHLVRWTGAVAFVLAVLLIVNLICCGPLYNVLSMVLNAQPIEIFDDVAGNSWNVSAQVGDAAVSRVTLLQSLADAGYSLNSELSDMYVKYANARSSITMNKQDWTLLEPTKDAYTGLMSSPTPPSSSSPAAADCS